MHDDGRFIPPGSGRTAAFAQKGGFPKSPLLSSGVAISAMCAVFYLLKHFFLSGFIDSFRVGVEDAVVRKMSAAGAFEESIKRVLLGTAPILFAAMCGISAVVLISTILTRKGRGATAVPLPKMPGAILPITGIRVFAAIVFVFSALLVARSTTTDVSSPNAWIEGIFALFFRVSAALGGILIFAGGAEVLIQRHQIYRALFLTRSEARRELRAETGNREPLKKAGQRARRKAGR
jgi:flagellar biosynthesis protein FlhB